MTGYGLCMAAPVSHLYILFSAGGTHGKFPHGDMIPVVRDRLHNTVAGAAVYAADKRIMVSAVSRLFHFRKTFFTNRQIRRKKREIRTILLLAFHNPEIRRTGIFLFCPLRLDPVHSGRRRCIRTKATDKVIHRLRISKRIYPYHSAAVADTSFDMKLFSQGCHKGPVTDSLYHAQNGNFISHVCSCPAVCTASGFAAG